jgi:hypothetical protein
MIPWIRILLYFSIFSFIIVTLKKKETPISNFEAAAAFAFKVLLGCLYGYIHLHYYNGDDTWIYNNEGIIACQKLKSDPLLFFTDLLPQQVNSLQTLKDFISKSLEHDLMVKIIAIFSFFSGGNYYVNVIFFNFFLFWGHYWLYHFLTKRYTDKRTALLIGIFFIPPLVFWLSGIRGDGLLFFFLTLLFLFFQNWLTNKDARYLVYAFLSMIGIFIFRSAIVFVLIPFLVGWLISERFRTAPLITYLFTYLFCGLFFFTAKYIHPALNLPAIVVNKQYEFSQLPGKTRYNIEPLKPELPSFIRAIPSAFRNSFLRPYLWEAKGTLQLLTAVETAAFLLYVFIILPFFQWNRVKTDPWLIGALFFSLSIFLFIGLTIPFPGAIIRYKVIPELLIVACLLASAGRIRNKTI